MTDLFRKLYENLLNGIEEKERNHPDLKKQIEACFHLSETIFREVDKNLASIVFETEGEEISFFKCIKPRFTTLVEFYSILYRAELFIPDTWPEQLEFWNYELQRAHLFLIRHEDILEYIRNGDTTNDKKYFLRNSPNKTCALHDELLAKLFAREKYVDYINTRLLPYLKNVNPLQ